MRSFRCIIASTAREIMDAQRVRWNVYVEEEGLLKGSLGDGRREADTRDLRDDTAHFIVYSDHEPVGTVRLLHASADVGAAPRGHLGLDLESKFDLGALCAPEIVPAEVTRFCVLRRYRCTGVASSLFSSLHAESLRRGVTHWVAGANMQTDFAEDAAIAYRIALAKGLVDTSLRAHLRAHELPQTPRKRPYYTEEQRLRARTGDLTGLQLPRPLSLFGASMGARYIGPPAYDDSFNVFALPLVTRLAELPAPRAILSMRAGRAHSKAA